MYRYYSEDIIRRLMAHEPSMFMTDAWIEPEGVQNASAYGCFPRFLASWHGKRRRSRWRTVVRKMSGCRQPTAIGLPQRGYLRPGCAADVTVFDAQRVASRGDDVHTARRH